MTRAQRATTGLTSTPPSLTTMTSNGTASPWGAMLLSPSSSRSGRFHVATMTESFGSLTLDLGPGMFLSYDAERGAHVARTLRAPVAGAARCHRTGAGGRRQSQQSHGHRGAHHGGQGGRGGAVLRFRHGSGARRLRT